MEFHKLSTPETLVERIASEVMQRIIDGTLEPGMRLPVEAELCEQLGVGRNSLREAMKKLSALGVVTVRRGDGTYINKEPGSSAYEALVLSLIVARSTPAELLELREKIEADVLELAAEHGTEDDVAALEEILERYHSALHAGDVDLAFDLDIAFHRRIADAGRNRLMKRILTTSLTMFLQSIRSSLWPEPVDSEWVNHAHIEMIDAIRRHAVDECAAIVRSSVRHWAQQFDMYRTEEPTADEQRTVR